MNTTNNTAVENKNFFSSLLNSIWKPENIIAIIFLSILFVILTGIICYGLKQPFEGFIAFFTVGFGVTILVCGIGTNHLRNHSIESLIFLPAFALSFIISGALAFIFSSKGVDLFAIIYLLGGLIGGTVSSIIAKELWKKKRGCYLSFFLILAIASAWLVFSNQLTDTKVGDVDLEMYSEVDGKLAKKSVFIPLFFSTIENEYFAVEKLTPRKIHVKVTIPDDPKSRWRGEQRLDDTIFVEFQPLNYEARKKILGSGLWQIEVETTSKVNSSAAIMVEIMKQLNLEPSDVNIKISEIGS